MISVIQISAQLLKLTMNTNYPESLQCGWQALRINHVTKFTEAGTKASKKHAVTLQVTLLRENLPQECILTQPYWSPSLPEVLVKLTEERGGFAWALFLQNPKAAVTSRAEATTTHSTSTGIQATQISYSFTSMSVSVSAVLTARLMENQHQGAEFQMGYGRFKGSSLSTDSAGQCRSGISITEILQHFGPESVMPVEMQCTFWGEESKKLKKRIQGKRKKCTWYGK